jgi:citrate lyase subunit beta/citryl-CoA lyase
VTAGAAAGLLAPVASAASIMDSTDDLRASTIALRRAGFRGRLCLEPAQVAVVNQVLHPSTVEVSEAHELLERHAAALRDGVGVVLDGHGRVVDETRIRRARRILAYG